MQPTMAILEKLQDNSKKNHDEVFTRLFRYMLRPDMYFTAYQKLYANKGAATKGVNEDTADGFSEDYVQQLIERLKDETYRPHPVRRTYIAKQNGKKRPLGIPTFTDKLVQEVLRMILESVYEPLFSRNSHGFRPNKSCHTALQQVKKDFTGVRWFIEGDIKGCFDNIDHTVLVGLIGRKIKDARLLKLVHAFLKAGYLEDWKYHRTYSGTPQGGIVSPILANIYLHELDQFVEQLKVKFDVHTPRGTFRPEYTRILNRRTRLSKKIQTLEGEERQTAIELYKKETAQMFKVPAKRCTDKRIKYVRYADDFLIGVNGDRQDCEWIKTQLTEFIGSALKMELSAEKTLITHSNTPARFLGYDIRVRRDQQVKDNGRGDKQRTLNGKVELNIPLADKIERFLFDKGIVTQREDNGKMESWKRPALLNLTDLEIVGTYNAELRGICNYYSLASNFNQLTYFGYLMEYSCLKTLANKYRSKISKVRKMFKDGSGDWGIPYETQKGKKRMYFVKVRDCKATVCKDMIFQIARNNTNHTTTFESRLKAKVCEVCGCTDSEKYVIHHVNKVKNLKGVQKWEEIMIAKRHKTMAVCHSCHMAIHHGEKKRLVAE